MISLASLPIFDISFSPSLFDISILLVALDAFLYDGQCFEVRQAFLVGKVLYLITLVVLRGIPVFGTFTRHLFLRSHSLLYYCTTHSRRREAYEAQKKLKAEAEEAERKSAV
jgi:hypothetical protein